MPIKIIMDYALELIFILKAWRVFVLVIGILGNWKVAKGDNEHAGRKLLDNVPGMSFILKLHSVLYLSLQKLAFRHAFFEHIPVNSHKYFILFLLLIKWQKVYTHEIFLDFFFQIL